MKKNIKIGIFSISIFYSIVVITLMILNLLSIKTEVYLSVDEDNENIIKQYREEISKLTQNECSKSISEMVDYYEITSYDGFVDLKEIYEYYNNNEMYMLTKFSNVKRTCYITDEEMNEYNLAGKAVNSAVNETNLIYNNNRFGYELSIKDAKARFLIDISTEQIEYQTRKKLEQEIIEDLIELAKNKEEVVVYEE